MIDRWDIGRVAWVLCVAAACDDGDAMRAADAGPTDPCDAALVGTGAWAVGRCRAPGRFGLHHQGRLTLLGSVGLRIAGEDLLADAWPLDTWGVDGTAVTVRMSGRSDLPALEARITFDGDAFVTLTVDPSQLQAPVIVDAWLPLVGTAVGLSPWGTLAPEDGDAPAGLTPAPRRNAQALLADGDALLVQSVGGTVSAAAPALTVTVDAGALSPGDRLALPPVRVARGTDGVFALLATGEASGEPGPTRWGWRSAGIVDVATLGQELDTLRAAAAEGGRGGAPWLLVEGPWFTAEWSAGPGWPDGLEAGVDALAPATVGLAWPLLADGRDPARPQVRTAIAREALALADAGVDWLALRGVTDFAPVVQALEPFTGPIATAEVAAVGGVDLLLAEPDSVVRAGRRLAVRAHLDALNEVAVSARLGGATGRQAAVLLAMGSGPALLADRPSALPPDTLARYFATLDPRLRGARPIGPMPRDGAPVVWATERALALFNWTEAPTRVAVDRPEFDGADRLLDPGPALRLGVPVEVPAQDVLVFVR